jgi:hypothetical protein
MAIINMGFSAKQKLVLINYKKINNTCFNVAFEII